ncbi:MAG: hypothetical protein ACK5II_13725 [Paracoccus sp. (in: a-proteobacteria)]
MRLLKILVVLLVIGLIALAGYAYLGDMAPRQQEVRQPINLELTDRLPSAPSQSDSTTEARQSDDNPSDSSETAESIDPNDQR